LTSCLASSLPRSGRGSSPARHGCRQGLVPRSFGPPPEPRRIAHACNEAGRSKALRPVEAVHPSALDQRREDRPGSRAGVCPGKQSVLPRRRNGLSILPTSGRILTSTTAGTLCMVAVSGCKAVNRAAMAVSILSSQHPATSRYCRNGCWTRSSVRAWKWERLGSRWKRSSTFSVS
jgi:hypothetical protein